MRPILWMLLCCWLVSPAVAQPASDQSQVPDHLRPPDQLRVLSYNIHHAEGTDGDLDLARIAAVIRSAEPDIVALQEVDRRVLRTDSVDQPAQLAELSGMRVVFGANIQLQGGQYGNAVLSKLPLIKNENILLPVRDKGEQRGVLVFDGWFFGRQWKFMATHFDHRRDDRERFASAEQLNQLATRFPNVPSILAGDINATRDSRVLKKLEEAWTIAGPELATIPAANPNRQIDFVLFRPPGRWEVIETRVLDEPIASDHRPILAVLRLQESQSDRAGRLAARSNVLSVTDDQGQVTEAKDTNQWQRRRRDIRLGIESVMGRLPGEAPRTPPEMSILQEVDCDTYIRRKITYRSQPDCETTAYLCIPKGLDKDGSRRVPAVLCLHPTDNVVGHDVVVGLGGKANRQYASELAQRGYVTLAPSYPLLADYQPDLHQLGWDCGTLKAVWDNMRGIDLLQSLPFVDGEAIGAIGHSLGGHNAVYTAVHDARIRAVVSSCGLDSYQDYYGGDPSKWLPEKGWTQTRYMPRLARYRGRLHDIPFDFHELLACLAPREVMVIAPLHDSNFRADSVDRVTAEARKVYALYRQADRLTVLHPDCGHDFPAEARQAAYRLFDRTLK